MNLNKDKIPTLPDEPGIYIFKNKENQTLYVGKAKSLKKRIKSYFSKSKDSIISHPAIAVISSLFSGWAA